MKEILLTGFEPFRNETINPSGEILKAFSEKCDTLLLPVSYERSWTVLLSHLIRNEYDFILMLGQAGGRANLCLERVAINLQDTETPDEDGVQRLQTQISATGPEAFMNPLSLRAWSQALQKMQVPAEVSFSAGAFVCNSIYYQAFQFLKEQGRATSLLFLHVPYLPEQVAGKPEGTPALALDEMVRGVGALLEIARL